MAWQRFEKLNYLSVTREASSSAVVLFHGYGADAADLQPLSQMDTGGNWDWFFPQGTLEVPIGPMMSGRAWFELSQKDFENLSQRKVDDKPIAKDDEQTLELAARWLNKLGSMYDNVIIGGFSQGAILTSHCFYRLHFQPKGLLLLSGFLASPSSFPTLSDAQKCSFFQSHGRRDEVLPLAGARQLFDHLESLGLAGEWMEFSGGHEIPMNVMAQSQSFLNSLLNS